MTGTQCAVAQLQTLIIDLPELLFIFLRAQCDIDQVDGDYIGKRRFLIFDYCGNFEFFREKPNGFEGRETKSLSENIFCKKIRLAAAMQESAFVDDKYQTWRSRIVDECHEQIMALNTSLVSVKLNLKYVEYFKDKKVLTVINESEKADLEYYIAPLVYNPEQDEYAIC